MVFTATNAKTFTNTAITIQDGAALQSEVDHTERDIRNAANRQLFKVAHNATFIGNPIGDPATTSNLTPIQITYRDTFIDAGYLVYLDAVTGYWGFSWESSNVEEQVSLYSVRTIVVPGGISDSTITTIEAYFNNLIPVSFARASLANVSPGADTDEDDFGAPISTFYEYPVLVTQQNPSEDYSAGLRAVLVGAGLGYTDTPSNVAVYKLV